MGNIILLGQVSTVDKSNRTAKVSFYDKGAPYVSGDLKVLKNSSFIPEKDVPQRTEYEQGGGGYGLFDNHKHDIIIEPWLPNVGDYVLCIYLENGRDGFVIGGI